MVPAALNILLALAHEPLHGYGIMQEVARQSEGAQKLGPGTLYDNLEKLLQLGLIEECPNPAEPRRRYYQLTEHGQTTLSEEIKRLETAFRRAKASLRRLKEEHV